MCPACITVAALAIGGATSAGGLAALVMKLVRATRRHRFHTAGAALGGEDTGDQLGKERE